MDWTSVIVAVVGLFAGGGIWSVFKAKIDKKKNPYDMLMEMLREQKHFYEERNAELEREKLESAEKSHVIMKSHFCKHRFTQQDVICPVDEANDERLKKRCERYKICEIQTNTDVYDNTRN